MLKWQYQRPALQPAFLNPLKGQWCNQLCTLQIPSIPGNTPHLHHHDSLKSMLLTTESAVSYIVTPINPQRKKFMQQRRGHIKEATIRTISTNGRVLKVLTEKPCNNHATQDGITTAMFHHATKDLERGWE